MLASRKPLAIALVLVVLFAMLVPAAMAAPQLLHGISIVSPTTASPIAVNPPPAPGTDTFKVKYNLTIVDTQVDDVLVQVSVVSPLGAFPANIVASQDITIQNATLQTGVNSRETASFAIPASAPDGWYGVVACAMDADWFSYLWCTPVEQNAVLVDRVNPMVNLEKPFSGAMVSGKNYLLVGTATDQWGINPDTVKFQYCSKSNWNQPIAGQCGPNDNSWVWIADGKPTPGIPGQYQAKWDSTQVPDDHGRVRICAKDLAGNSSCSGNDVYVVNRFTVYLHPGWNLVSTPLMLYDDDMDAVMFHLKDPLTGESTVKSVWTAKNTNTGWPNVYQWQKWMPGDDMKFKHGQGYWINMKGDGFLTFVGSFKDVGPAAPPTYQVFKGWNLIGYTHWGQPATNWHWIGDKLVGDYLGVSLSPSVQALWRYDAASEQYVPTNWLSTMVKGAGYWLGLAQGGIITP